MDKYCEDCIHNEVCRYEAYCPSGHCNDKETLDDIRPQGEWVHLQAMGDYKCSICDAENLYKYANEHERWIKTNSNFCPNCGANMRKKHQCSLWDETNQQCSACNHPCPDNYNCPDYN